VGQVATLFFVGDESSTSSPTPLFLGAGFVEIRQREKQDIKVDFLMNKKIKCHSMFL